MTENFTVLDCYLKKSKESNSYQTYVPHGKTRKWPMSKPFFFPKATNKYSWYGYYWS